MEDKYQVLLRFNAHYRTESVEVVGDFTGWQENTIHLEKTGDGNIWKTYMELPSGEYAYHFVIDGNCRHLDPYNPHKIQREGRSYSKLIVGQAQKKTDAFHCSGDIDVCSSDTIYLSLRVIKDDFRTARLIIMVNDSPQSVPGFLLYNDIIYSHYKFKFQNSNMIESCFYYFELVRKDGNTVYFGNNGIVGLEWEVESYEYKINNSPSLVAPEWVKKAVFYQIFPDRFYNGNKNSDPPSVSNPGVLPDSGTYYGGDFEGIIEKIDHLKTLDISALYFNPVFEAKSPHKYDTGDYRKIDPHFGTMEVFDKLKDILSINSMRFILDGVFNHTGTGFFAFKDIEKNGLSSIYKNWYFIKKMPLIENGKPNYDCWWNFPSLPKLNVHNSEVKAYIFETARYWILKGASGWRLDVPNEIDHSFWKDFRQYIKSVDPEAFITGEIWHDGSPWLKGDEFDSVLNYRFRDACVEFFARKKMSSENFIIEIGRQLDDYPMNSNFTLLNLLSSHDTPRFYTLALKNINRVKLAVAFQFTYLGVPMIYYGEEIGMEGGQDPDNRRAMEWDNSKWNMEIYEFYLNMIRLRHENRVLSDGDIRFFYGENGIIGFERFSPEDKLTIIINNSDSNFQIDLTSILGNGDFIDISKNHLLKRKKVFTLYTNDFVILRKIKER